MYKKIAVLIDAENVRIPSVIAPIVRSAQSAGHISALVLFGNLNSPALDPWKGANITALLGKCGAVWSPVPTTRPGKNAADIALTFEAALIARDGKANEIWLVSGDSDFTAMVLKLQATGVRVVVFGPKNTPQRLRNACSSFILIDDLGDRPKTGLSSYPTITPQHLTSTYKETTAKQTALKLSPDNHGWFHGFVRRVGKTFGFIQVNPTDSVFFHAGGINYPMQMTDLRSGDYVEFHIVNKRDGVMAVHVRKMLTHKANIKN